MVPCVWMAPLGSAVLPELYTTTSGSAGTTHASTRARNAAPMPARSPASTIDASSPRDQERSDAPHTWMARRNGASARTNRSSADWPLERDPYLLETSVPGVLAAGDVRHASIKRCSAAVGEGSMAIAVVHRYLAERDGSAERAQEAGTGGGKGAVV